MARAQNLNHNHINGFTLLEILIGLSLLTVMFAMGASSYLSWKQHQEDAFFAEQFVSQLRFARRYALQNHCVVQVCPSVDRHHCSNNWSDPISVFYNDQLLRVLAPQHHNIVWHSSLAKNDRLTFVASGATNGQQGSFDISHDGQQIAIVTINQAGRIKWSS